MTKKLITILRLGSLEIQWNLFFSMVKLPFIKQTGFDYDGAIYAIDWDGQTYIKGPP